MSIPVSIDPMGTLGAGKELTFVQPLYNDSGVLLRQPNVPMHVSGTSSEANEEWCVFRAENGSREDSYCWRWFAGGQIVLQFERAVKITSLKVIQTSFLFADFYATALTLEADGSNIASATGLGPDDMAGVTLMPNQPVFATEYKLKITGIASFAHLGISAEIKP